MSREKYTSDDKQPQQNQDVLNGSVAIQEHVRGGTPRDKPDPKPHSPEEGIPLFWRIFGGTLLSIFALICITVYNQFSNSLNELRRELAQQQEARTDLIKKDEFNSRLTIYWSGLKELQTATSTISALNERWRLLDQQVDKYAKLSEQDRKDLNTKVEDIRKSHLQQGDDWRKTADAERKEISRQLEEVRKNLDQSAKDLARKLEDQTKSAQEDRKEWTRKLDDQVKILTDDRRDLNQKIQVLGERLAALEGRQGVLPSQPKKNNVDK